MREQIIKLIEEHKIIAIVRGVERENLISLAKALYDAGIRFLELTYSADGKVSDEEMADRVKRLVDEFDGKMYFGSGTVLSEKQVELTKKAGGTFIISPDTYENVIRKTRELEMVSIPGAFTPSEIQAAHRYGADFVKMFPMSNMGVSYLKAVKAPLSHIKLLVVGGVTLDNIGEFLDGGAAGFGIGTNFVDKKLIAEGRFDKITENAVKYVEAVKR